MAGVQGHTALCGRGPWRSTLLFRLLPKPHVTQLTSGGAGIEPQPLTLRLLLFLLLYTISSCFSLSCVLEHGQSRRLMELRWSTRYSGEGKGVGTALQQALGGLGFITFQGDCLKPVSFSVK